MTDEERSTSPPSTREDREMRAMLEDPAAVAWLDAHAADMRRGATGQRYLYSTLVAGFVVGLVAYLAGYLLGSTTPAEPWGLLADLFYTFGLALWTGVVIVVFVQIYPEAKRRQVIRWLDVYEAVRREKAPRSDR
jgi:F0F1-type ATP synthase assembly protein I